MLSVILYGRNDSYGYNLHKRAALSLNTIAEVLDAPGDEILFVDYNTPDDFPTFPEAIADVLTAKARARLRVLRVRPAQHARFCGLTHLQALEPVARNVALRRMNPANRWVLSTNTDMIFVPRAAPSLSAIVAGLADGYYHSPRYEIPESLWESLDRLDAPGTIATVAAWGEAFHLNEIVRADNPSFAFDGPGDFQLMLRSDLLRMGGFDERMLLGWHVDANIAHRLALLRGPTGELVDELRGYHCDHTRQVTPAHRPGSVANDWRVFVSGVTTPEAPDQENWGLADQPVEDIRLDDAPARYRAALLQAVGTPMPAPSTLVQSRATRELVDYDARHVVPFLIDALVAYPRNTRLGWFGGRRELLDRFATAWHGLGFTAPILVAEGADWLGATLPAPAQAAALERIGQEADAFVFDFAPPLQGEPTQEFVAAGLRAMAAAEDAHLARPLAERRRFIGVNAVHNQWESLVGSIVGAATAPLATRLRQGLRNPPVTLPADLLPRLLPGNAGRRVQDGIAMLPGRAGQVLHGPPMLLAAGRYRLELRLSGAAWGLLRVTVHAWPTVLVRRYPLLLPGRQRIVLDFDMPAPGGVAQSLEVRATSIGLATGVFTGALLSARRH